MNWAGSDAASPIPAPAQGFVALERLLDDVLERFASGRGFAIATLNLDHAVKLRRCSVFRDAYHAHSHVTADGNPVVWLERLAGRSADLVPGSDLVVPLSEIATRAGKAIALVGSSQDALRGAAQALSAKVPGIDVRACIAPPFGFDPDSDAAGEIIARLSDDASVGLVFLALGAPKQEVFAARFTREAPQLGVVSVGAGLDFLAGVQKRAPRVVRRFAMEWLWRLSHEPRRLAGRYALCATVLPGMGVQALRARLRHDPRPPTTSAS